MTKISTGYSRSINLMIMLGFFTSTAMQRLFTMQTTIPGTAKSITLFISSLKSDIPEVSKTKFRIMQIENTLIDLNSKGSNDYRTICTLATVVVDIKFQISLPSFKKNIPGSVFVGSCRSYTKTNLKCLIIEKFNVVFIFNELGLLTKEERNALEDHEKSDPSTPRPLVVIDCKTIMLNNYRMLIYLAYLYIFEKKTTCIPLSLKGCCYC